MLIIAVLNSPCFLALVMFTTIFTRTFLTFMMAAAALVMVTILLRTAVAVIDETKEKFILITMDNT